VKTKTAPGNLDPNSLPEFQKNTLSARSILSEVSKKSNSFIPPGVSDTDKSQLQQEIESLEKYQRHSAVGLTTLDNIDLPGGIRQDDAVILDNTNQAAKNKKEFSSGPNQNPSLRNLNVVAKQLAEKRPSNVSEASVKHSNINDINGEKSPAPGVGKMFSWRRPSMLGMFGKKEDDDGVLMNVVSTSNKKSVAAPPKRGNETQIMLQQAMAKNAMVQESISMTPTLRRTEQSVRKQNTNVMPTIAASNRESLHDDDSDTSDESDSNENTSRNTSQKVFHTKSGISSRESLENASSADGSIGLGVLPQLSLITGSKRVVSVMPDRNSGQMGVNQQDSTQAEPRNTYYAEELDGVPEEALPKKELIKRDFVSMVFVIILGTSVGLANVGFHQLLNLLATFFQTFWSPVWSERKKKSILLVRKVKKMSKNSDFGSKTDQK